MYRLLHIAPILYIRLNTSFHSGHTFSHICIEANYPPKTCWGQNLNQLISKLEAKIHGLLDPERFSVMRIIALLHKRQQMLSIRCNVNWPVIISNQPLPESA